ncbi:MAG TPA: LytTR family DNA-binding domain-containing protein, partial [Cyclobacteriaceae bacterium]|nr:LytTR family DNA-binding domain-containing protein [Cyclobacteriaceae bacterium]
KEIRPGVRIVGSLDSVRSAVKWINENPSPDLFFMDIQLADGLSFEIFDKINIKAPVIFTTAYNEYALRAFKVNSIDYILKPLDKDEVAAAFRKYENLTGAQAPTRERMMESIESAMQMLTKKYKERFVIKVGEHLRSVEVGEILFFYSLEKTTFAQAGDRKHILDYTLDQLEGLLDPARFFRINRKYIVSVSSIKDMISYTNSRLKLVLKSSDDDDIIVARERVQEFKDWLDK